MSKASRRPNAIIAATQDDATFKAVRLRMHDGVVEVLWARMESGKDRTWADFSATCGLPVAGEAHDGKLDKHVASVVGLNSPGVAFYRVSVPTVGDHETAAIVRMQAESLLPLPAEQIEVAWRTVPSENGKMEITIAAARRDHLQRFAGAVRSFRPRRIVLSCEGTARAWRRLFSDGERQAVIVSLGQENTQVCMVHDDVVTHAAVLDTGMSDLASSVQPDGSTQVIERFVQDMKTVLDSFGWDASSQWPVIVLSDGGEAIEQIVKTLDRADLPAKTALPKPERVQMPAQLEMADIYEYRTSLGLGLIALESSSGTLDLFERISADDVRREVTSARRSVTVAGIVAVVMLLILLVVWRTVDVAMAARLNNQIADPNFQAAGERQVLLKMVARHRPDVLQLLTDIHAGPSDGIILDNLHFKKGQAVTIAGRAGNMEQMWKFQEGLIEQKAFGDVEITTQTADPKTKKIKFAMTFHYKGFTKKGATL